MFDLNGAYFLIAQYFVELRHAASRAVKYFDFRFDIYANHVPLAAKQSRSQWLM